MPQYSTDFSGTAYFWISISMTSDTWDNSSLNLKHFLEEGFGAYSLRNLKESLSLDKKSKKLLKYISNSNIELNFWLFEKNRSPKSKLAKYLFEYDRDVFSIKKGKLVMRSPQWNNSSLTLSRSVLDRNIIIKEKLAVSNDVKGLLGEVLVKLDLSSVLSRYPKENLGRFKIESCFLKGSRIKKRPIITPKMVNRLDIQINELIDETIKSEVPLFQDLDLKALFPKKNTNHLQNYMLHLISPCAQLKKKRIISCYIKGPKWIQTPETSTSQRFRNLRFRSQDEDFHAFELFKLESPVEKLKRSRLHRCQKKITKVKWRVREEVLQRLNWNPFEGIEFPDNSDLVETIKQVEYMVKPPTVTFKRLYSSRLDLITEIPVSFAPFEPIEQFEHETSTKLSSPAREEKIAFSSTNSSNDEVTDIENVSHKRLINQSKRSFIDDDLISIIAAKRKRLSFSNLNCINATEDSLNLTTSTILSPKISFEVDEIFFESARKKTVIFNSIYLHKNHPIIRFMSQNHFSILELELGDACDILVDTSTCIVIRDLQMVSQKRDDSFPIIDLIQTLKLKYKRVCLLLSYTENVLQLDQNLAYKSQLLLNSCYEINTHLIEEHNIKIIADWISVYSSQSNPIEQQLDSISPAKKLLQSFDINPFAIETILTLSSLDSFLSMSYGKRALLYGKYLTDYQLLRIDEFVTMSWN